MYGWNANSYPSKQAMEAMEAAVAMPYSGRNHNCLYITKAGLSAAGILRFILNIQ